MLCSSDVVSIPAGCVWCSIHISVLHVILDEVQNGQLNGPVYHHLIGLTMFNFLHLMGIQLCSRNKRKEIGGTVRRKTKKKPFMFNPAARGEF